MFSGRIGGISYPNFQPKPPNATGQDFQNLVKIVIREGSFEMEAEFLETISSLDPLGLLPDDLQKEYEELRSEAVEIYSSDRLGYCHTNQELIQKISSLLIENNFKNRNILLSTCQEKINSLKFLDPIAGLSGEDQKICNLVSLYLGRGSNEEQWAILENALLQAPVNSSGPFASNINECYDQPQTPSGNARGATVGMLLDFLLDFNDPSMTEPVKQAMVEHLLSRDYFECLSLEEESQYNRLLTFFASPPPLATPKRTNQNLINLISEICDEKFSLENPGLWDLYQTRQAILFSLDSLDQPLSSEDQALYDEISYRLSKTPNAPEPGTAQSPFLERIAQHLWLDPEVVISDEMHQKVDVVNNYLRYFGLELGGVKADGDCFCNAFLKSYGTLSRKIPILDAQENKVSYLREAIAAAYRIAQRSREFPDIERAGEIRQEGMWLTASNEGELLANALGIPLRVITVNQDQNGCGVSDMFTDTDGESCEWMIVEEERKSLEHVCIVDLGGHFVYAQPVKTAEKRIKSARSISQGEGDDLELHRPGKKRRIGDKEENKTDLQ